MLGQLLILKHSNTYIPSFLPLGCLCWFPRPIIRRCSHSVNVCVAGHVHCLLWVAAVALLPEGDELLGTLAPDFPF